MTKKPFESHLGTKVLILDFGSQYTQLIARRVREQGIFSYVLPGDTSLEDVKQFSPDALILSGGPCSVYDVNAPKISKGLFEYQKKTNLPMLGICYGMQLIAHELCGEVKRGVIKEYGKMKVHCENQSVIFNGVKEFTSWMSHGDETVRVPDGFKVTCKTASGIVAAMENEERNIVAFQFHPEVTHTEHGEKWIQAFLFDVAKLKADWTMKSLKGELIDQIKASIDENAHVICALSGGVDSTVAATLVHEAIGDRLHCVFVDHGLLRFDEGARVMQLFENQLHLPVTRVHAKERFLKKLKGISDPEQKRKIIGGEFIAVFDEFAKELESELGHVPKYLVQGTLYPDVIESSPAPGDGQKKHSTTIKSHHNVGGLPKDLRFTLVEPLRDLFKDEVRLLGKELSVPESFLKRHPFPGPGLAVRILGEITEPRIETLQKADEIFINALHEFSLYDEIWQAFAVYLPIKTVGVQGDGRTHADVIGLRAVCSRDGMTADVYPFSFDVLASISSRICNELDAVNRVVYDCTSKPPATIEWE